MEASEILPTDCWQCIFNHLDNDGLEAVSLVCKDFFTISNICKDSLTVIHPGIGMISKHLKRFKQLKKINFRTPRGYLDEAILEIARSDISLEVLNDPYLDEFKIGSLKELSSYPKMKNLKVLNCYWACGILDDDYVGVIANSFPNLEELGIESSNYFSQCLTDYGVEILASKLKLLKKIHISGKYSLSDRSLVALASNCVFLKDFTMEIHRDHGVTEHGFGFLLRNRPNLEALLIRFMGLHPSQSTINIENSISHAKALTSLEFSDMDIPDKLLIAIAKAKLQLKKLVLISSTKFAVTGLLMDLSDYLTELCIKGADITDSNLVTVLSKDLRKLIRIEISNCNVTESTLFLLPTKCPSLEEIRMETTAVGSKLNDNVPVPSFKNNGVKNLYLANNYLLEDESLKEFGHVFPNLKVLDLSYCNDQITSTGIQYILESCKNIRKLILEGYTKEKMIEADSELSELKLEVLNLSCSMIDDEGIAVISNKCPRLMHLNLNGCQDVTTEGIKHIVRNIKLLTSINIMYCEAVESYHLLEWMLSTGFLASLKQIYLPVETDITDKQRQEFERRGCLLH